jgi:hypothetical protein
LRGEQITVRICLREVKNVKRDIRPKAIHYTGLPMNKISLWKMDTMFSGLVPGPRSIIQLVCIVWREHRGLAAILKMAAKMLTKLHNMRYRQHTMKCLV